MKIKQSVGVLGLILFCICGCAADLYTDSFQFTQTAVCRNEIRQDSYGFFQIATDSQIVIPGLEQNFVPQGICFWEHRNWFILSGYFRPAIDQAAAVLLAVDARSGKLAGEYTLADSRGKACGGHFAGVAVTDSKLYVTDGYSLHQISLNTFGVVGRKGVLRVEKTVPISADAGTCNYSDGILWVCEHYQKQDYPLKGEHTLQNNDGTLYHAWMIGYRVTEEGLRPYCVFSVPDTVQGITAMDDGRIVLSCSYGRTNPSQILICRDPRENTPDGFVKVEGQIVPLWHLDEQNGIVRYDAPPMSEGCCAVGDEVYVIFESGAYFYRAFSPENPAVDPTDKIWQLQLPKE